jgi:hypothetical protein
MQTLLLIMAVLLSLGTALVTGAGLLSLVFRLLAWLR